MKQALAKTWEFIQRIDEAADEANIEAVLREITEPFGLSSIFGGVVPTRRLSREKISERILVQRFPEGWAERYNALDYVFKDPIVQRLQSERAPFSWDDAYQSFPSAAGTARFIGEASDFGLRAGFVVPVSLLDGSVAAVSFGGSAADLSPDDQALLSFVASYSIGHLLQHRYSTLFGRSVLTAREYECLLWAAEGKTDWETAMILGISKPTVTKHILSAREKLGGVTKAHAIAIALRRKIIR